MFFASATHPLALYTSGKLISDPIGFSKVGSIKKIFSNKSKQQNDTFNWNNFNRYLKKSITKAYYCRSPLEGQTKNQGVNKFISFLMGSQKMHHQIIIQVQEMVYFLINYHNDGLQIQNSLDFDALKIMRDHNEIVKQKSFSKELKVQQLIEQLKTIPHEKENYDPVLYNCQKFSKQIWNFITSK